MSFWPCIFDVKVLKQKRQNIVSVGLGSWWSTTKIPRIQDTDALKTHTLQNGRLSRFLLVAFRDFFLSERGREPGWPWTIPTTIGGPVGWIIPPNKPKLGDHSCHSYPMKYPVSHKITLYQSIFSYQLLLYYPSMIGFTMVYQNIIRQIWEETLPGYGYITILCHIFNISRATTKIKAWRSRKKRVPSLAM